MPVAWTPRLLRLFRRAVELGWKDNQVCAHMRSLGCDLSVHSVRSQRGRMERAGTIKKGLSGSSKEKKDMAKRITRERWTKKALNRLKELYLEGKTNGNIARTLKREELRKRANPGAVGDQLSTMRKTAEVPPVRSTKVPVKQGALPFNDVGTVTGRVSALRENLSNLPRTSVGDVDRFLREGTESNNLKVHPTDNGKAPIVVGDQVIPREFLVQMGNVVVFKKNGTRDVQSFTLDISSYNKLLHQCFSFYTSKPAGEATAEVEKEKSATDFVEALEKTKGENNT
jgi:hypothetical protein